MAHGNCDAKVEVTAHVAYVIYNMQIKCLIHGETQTPKNLSPRRDWNPQPSVINLHKLQLNSYTMHCWFTSGGFVSVTFKSS